MRLSSTTAPEKYLLSPFVDRVRVVFAFSAAGPAFKAGPQAWGVQGGCGAGVWGYRGTGKGIQVKGYRYRDTGIGI